MIVIIINCTFSHTHTHLKLHTISIMSTVRLLYIVVNRPNYVKYISLKYCIFLIYMFVSFFFFFITCCGHVKTNRIYKKKKTIEILSNYQLIIYSIHLDIILLKDHIYRKRRILCFYIIACSRDN